MISATDVVGHPSGIDAGVRAVRESGLRVTGLEALRDFEGLDGRMHAYKVDVAKSMLEVCGRLGGRLLLVEASTSTHADADADAIARDLRKLAILAIPMGIRIALQGRGVEPHRASDFAAAGELVFRANCPNLGVAIDAFDVIAARHSAGRPRRHRSASRSSWSSSPTTCGRRSARPRSRRRRRRISASFPARARTATALADFVTKLDAIGYCGDYSFDVYNDDYLQMPPETVAGRARRAAEWLGETVLRRALPVPNMERLRRTARE